MAEETPDLELPSDLAFERRQWTVEGIAWVLMLIAIIAALLGYLGPGLLSRETRGSDGGLQAEYHRFERSGADTDMKITIPTSAIRDGQVRLWLAREFLDAIDLEYVSPEPLRMEAAEDRYIFHLGAQAAGDKTQVRLRYRPDPPWSRTVRMGIVDGEELSFHQFVYP